MTETEGHPNLVIEDDGVQHYRDGGYGYIYHPDQGVFRLLKSSTGYSATFWPGPPGGGMFADNIASGFTLRAAIEGAMGGSSRSPGTPVKSAWLDAFAKRIEEGGWLS